jgi:hypothetical protein
VCERAAADLHRLARVDRAGVAERLGLAELTLREWEILALLADDQATTGRSHRCSDCRLSKVAAALHLLLRIANAHTRQELVAVAEITPHVAD